MGAMLAYSGGCHCGALNITFETTVAPELLQRRACQCSFCRSHGVVSVSDPDGALRIDAKADALVRYRFGLKTADFLICARCGIYIVSIFEDGDEMWGVVNANAARTHIVHFAHQAVAYDGETPATRGEAQASLDTARGVQHLRLAAAVDVEVGAFH
jgi:hypothetical protein